MIEENEQLRQRMAEKDAKIAKLEEALEQMMWQLNHLRIWAAEPDTASQYHEWNVKNEGDVDWRAVNHREARGGVVYAKATMDIRNNRDAESPL